MPSQKVKYFDMLVDTLLMKVYPIEAKKIKLRQMVMGWSSSILAKNQNPVQDEKFDG